MKLLHYLKYFLFHLIGIGSIFLLLSGGNTLIIGFFAIIAFYLLGDAYAGEDTSIPNFKYPSILTVQLWMALPLLALITFTFI